MTDDTPRNTAAAPERIWTQPDSKGMAITPVWPYKPDAQRNMTEYVRADLARERLEEMTRRRDEWRKKAEGYDEVRRALREKVGAPWPPSLSRALWAGIAADEKKRADDAEARLEAAEAMARALKGMLAHSCVADAGPDMKDPDDHSAETCALRSLAAWHAAPPQDATDRLLDIQRRQDVAAIRALKSIKETRDDRT